MARSGKTRLAVRELTFGVESSYGCSDMSAHVTLNCGLPLGPTVISDWYWHLELGFVAEACLREV
jgi:hypothetical protein